MEKFDGEPPKDPMSLSDILEADIYIINVVKF